MTQHHAMTMEDQAVKVAKRKEQEAMFEEQKKLADQNDVTAQVNVGMCYLEGSGVLQNYRTAVEWFQRAAIKGHAMALNGWGLCYEFGLEDHEKAMWLFRLAAKNGSADAKTNLTMTPKKTHEVKSTHFSSSFIEDLISLAAAGVPEAEVELALAYSGGPTEVTRNKAKTERYLISASKKPDNPAGQFALGWCYAKGFGVPQDSTKAVKCYRTAVDQGYVHAQNALQNELEAQKASFQKQQKLADLGNVEAQFSVGWYYSIGFGVKQDDAKAVEWYQKAATKGHARALNNWGWAYHNGVGITQNLEIATWLFRLAAKYGDPLAKDNLSICQKDLEAKKTPFSSTIDELTKLANASIPEAEVELGLAYSEGLMGVPKDETKAKMWFISASKKTDTSAGQYAQGICHAKGFDIAKDELKATECYQLAATQGYARAQKTLEIEQKEQKATFDQKQQLADQGDATAQNYLGWCFYNGRGVGRDDQKALEWFKKAATKGNARSQLYWGWYYENGFVVKKNLEKAMWLYHLAEKNGDPDATTYLRECEKAFKTTKIPFSSTIEELKQLSTVGSPEAEVELGRAYRSGLVGVTIDDAEAKKWFMRAAQKTNTVAGQYALGVCYQEGWPDGQINQGYAVQAYQYAAQHGYAHAQNILALCYDEGRLGVTKNSQTAIAWYTQAVNQHHMWALYNLGLCYDLGAGVLQNYTYAAYLLMEATNQGCVSAQRKLASYYLAGSGIEQSDQKALEILQKVGDELPTSISLLKILAPTGDQDAQTRLGIEYFNGWSGIAANKAEAKKWLSLAAQNPTTPAGKYAQGLCLLEGLDRDKDEKTAMELIIQAAHLNYAPAQNFLGLCHIYGKRVPKNEAQGIQLLHLAAANGLVAAKCNLGWCYEYSHGVSKNLAIAVQFYRLAAEQGSARAQLLLASCYQHAKGVTFNQEEALKLCRLAAEREYAPAQFRLAEYCEEGKAIPQDFVKMAQLYQSAANQELWDAQTHLAFCHLEGIGVAFDEKESVKLYQSATTQLIDFAKNEDIDSQAALGSAYLNADLGVKDSAEAKKWLQLVAAQSNNVAASEYAQGVCFFEGFSGKKDEKKAVECFRRSAEKGFALAENFLSFCYRTGRGVAKDLEEAVRHYTLAVKIDRTLGRAQNNLGECYEQGLGVKIKDEKKAVEYYRLGAKWGSMSALTNLARCYANGISVVKNEEQALRCCYVAAKCGYSLAQKYLGAYLANLAIAQNKFREEMIYGFTVHPNQIFKNMLNYLIDVAKGKTRVVGSEKKPESKDEKLIPEAESSPLAKNARKALLSIYKSLTKSEVSIEDLQIPPDVDSSNILAHIFKTIFPSSAAQPLQKYYLPDLSRDYARERTPATVTSISVPPLDDEGAKALIIALNDPDCKLTSIDLRNNKISTEVTMALAKTIALLKARGKQLAAIGLEEQIKSATPLAIEIVKNERVQQEIITALEHRIWQESKLVVRENPDLQSEQKGESKQALVVKTWTIDFTEENDCGYLVAASGVDKELLAQIDHEADLYDKGKDATLLLETKLDKDTAARIHYFYSSILDRFKAAADVYKLVGTGKIAIQKSKVAEALSALFGFLPKGDIIASGIGAADSRVRQSNSENYMSFFDDERAKIVAHLLTNLYRKKIELKEDGWRTKEDLKARTKEVFKVNRTKMKDGTEISLSNIVELLEMSCRVLSEENPYFGNNYCQLAQNDFSTWSETSKLKMCLLEPGIRSGIKHQIERNEDNVRLRIDVSLLRKSDLKKRAPIPKGTPAISELDQTDLEQTNRTLVDYYLKSGKLENIDRAKIILDSEPIGMDADSPEVEYRKGLCCELGSKKDLLQAIQHYVKSIGVKDAANRLFYLLQKTEHNGSAVFADHVQYYKLLSNNAKHCGASLVLRDYLYTQTVTEKAAPLEVDQLIANYKQLVETDYRTDEDDDDEYKPEPSGTEVQKRLCSLLSFDKNQSQVNIRTLSCMALLVQKGYLGEDLQDKLVRFLIMIENSTTEDTRPEYYDQAVKIYKKMCKKLGIARFSKETDLTKLGKTLAKIESKTADKTAPLPFTNPECLYNRLCKNLGLERLSSELGVKVASFYILRSTEESRKGTVLAHYVKLSEQKYAPACFRLGQIYEGGELGEKKDAQKALQQYRTAAGLGFADAEYKMCLLLKDSKVDSEVTEMLQYLVNAYEHHHHDALKELCDVIRTHELSEKQCRIITANKSKWIQKNPRLLEELGDYYYRHHDFTEAQNYYVRALSEGNNNPEKKLYNLGVRYLKEKNYEAAYHCFEQLRQALVKFSRERAAKYLPIIYQLGYLSTNPEEISRIESTSDCKITLNAFSVWAKCFDMILKDSKITELLQPREHAYATLAMGKYNLNYGGNQTAERQLYQGFYAYAEQYLKDGNVAQGIQYYEKASEYEKANLEAEKSALLKLGDLYQEGRLVKKDLAHAHEYYAKALTLAESTHNETFAKVIREKLLAKVVAVPETKLITPVRNTAATPLAFFDYVPRASTDPVLPGSPPAPSVKVVHAAAAADLAPPSTIAAAFVSATPLAPAAIASQPMVAVRTP